MDTQRWDPTPCRLESLTDTRRDVYVYEYVYKYVCVCTCVCVYTYVYVCV